MHIPVLYDDTANPSCKQTGFAVFNIMFKKLDFKPNETFITCTGETLVGISRCLLSFIAQYKSGSVSLVTAYSLLYTFLSCSCVLNFSVRQNGFDQVI